MTLFHSVSGPEVGLAEERKRHSSKKGIRGIFVAYFLFCGMREIPENVEIQDDPGTKIMRCFFVSEIKCIVFRRGVLN